MFQDVGLSNTWSRNGNCTASWFFSKPRWATCVTSVVYPQSCSLETDYYPTNFLVNMIFLNITSNTRICSSLQNSSTCVQYFTVKAYSGPEYIDTLNPNTQFKTITKLPGKHGHNLVSIIDSHIQI